VENPFHHYSPAVNALVILALALLATWVVTRFRDEARARRAREQDEREYAAMDEAEARERAELLARDESEAAAGRRRVGCWVCDGEFYVPADDPGDYRGRFNCESPNCAPAF